MIGCEYIPVAVSVVVTVAEGAPPDTTVQSVKDALRRVLWPLADGGFDRQGWPLGRALSNRELAVEVARVQGVSEVGGLNLFSRVLPPATGSRLAIRAPGASRTCRSNAGSCPSCWRWSSSRTTRRRAPRCRLPARQSVCGSECGAAGRAHRARSLLKHGRQSPALLDARRRRGLDRLAGGRVHDGGCRRLRLRDRRPRAGRSPVLPARCTAQGLLSTTSRAIDAFGTIVVLGSRNTESAGHWRSWRHGRPRRALGRAGQHEHCRPGDGLRRCALPRAPGSGQHR